MGTDVANVDAWGRRLGYCAYDYGSAAVTAATGTARIRGSTASSPTDSWVAIVVVSAGPDGVINTPCPAVDTAASSVVATGDDMVAARSYGEMVSFGNAQIASSLSGLGTNTTNKLCRLGSDGKMICDVVVTPNALCRVDSTGTPKCDMVATNKLCRFDSTGTPKCDVTYPTNGCDPGYYLAFNPNSNPPSFQCTPVPSSQLSLRPYPFNIACSLYSPAYKETKNDTYIYSQNLVGGAVIEVDVVYDRHTGALLFNGLPNPCPLTLPVPFNGFNSSTPIPLQNPVAPPTLRPYPGNIACSLYSPAYKETKNDTYIYSQNLVGGGVVEVYVVYDSHTGALLFNGLPNPCPLTLPVPLNGDTPIPLQ